MKQKRIRIGRLDTAGGIAYEHGKILKKLMRELIDPQLASRLSGMFVNQRTLIEYESRQWDRVADRLSATFNHECFAIKGFCGGCDT